jgi:hypothetical protein
VIRYAPENLLPSSENLSAFSRDEVLAPVIISGGPTGSFSQLAVTATSAFHFYRTTTLATQSVSSMMWVLAKRGTARYLRVGGGSASSFDWDTLSWSATSPAHQTLAPVSHPFGDGWYWLPVFRSATGLFDICPSSTSGTSFNFNQSSVETVMVAAVQLSRSFLPQIGDVNYYKTTGSQFYGPRFDHDTASPFACRGLLIEEQRTNLTAQSGNASSWPNANGTVTNNGSTTAPDGSSNGFLGGIGTASLITPATSSVTGIHTASVFLKRNNTDWARIQVGQGSFVNAVNFWVNLATGTAGTLAVAIGTPTSLSAQVTPFGNSWYRVSITASYPATDSISLTVISATANNSATRVSGSVYEVWGAQLEAGSFPTSYIPTTIGPATRSADVCSITGGDFSGFYNQPEGTFFASAMIANLVGENRGIAQIDNGDNSHHIRIVYENTNGGFRNTVRANDIATQLGNNAGSANVSQKLIISYQGTSYAGTVNGATVTTTTRTQPTGLSTLRIGTLVGNFYAGGHISAIRYFRKRLPNAKLQSLTAP